MAVSNKYDIPDITDELNFWGARVWENVKKNFRYMDINMTDSDRGTGDLYRSIFWKAYNAAGGDMAMVKFFYLKYGDFVEWGVGTGVKKWPIPPMQFKEPIKHPRFNRRAKAFIRSEVIRNTRWLGKVMAEKYCFFGALYYMKRLSDVLDDPNPTIQWVNNNKDKLPRSFRDLW